MTQLRLHIRDMDCAEEATLVRRALAARPGVIGLDFDLVGGFVEVGFDPRVTSAQDVLAAVHSTGMEVHVSDDRAVDETTGVLGSQPHEGVHRHHTDLWMVASGLCLGLGWLVEGLTADHWLEGLAGHAHDPRAAVWYAMSAAAALFPMLPRAVAAVRHHYLDMHVLVCVSVAGAAAIGEWSEGAAVAFLFALAHRMEAWSIERARAALATLTGRRDSRVWSGMHQPAPTERWIERFAAVYTPLVTATALAVAVVPPLVTGDWGLWFYRALVFLVLACPCAMVISTPVTVVAAVTSAARRGVVIKGGAPLERAARAEAPSAGALAAVGVVVAGPADPDVRLAEAHVIILHGSPSSAGGFLVSHARRTMSVIRQNVGVALVTKLAFLVFAAIGVATLWMAVLADTGATVVVTLNGLRLLRAHTGARG